jgi:hypothetical protein
MAVSASMMFESVTGFCYDHLAHWRNTRIEEVGDLNGVQVIQQGEISALRQVVTEFVLPFLVVAGVIEGLVRLILNIIILPVSCFCCGCDALIFTLVYPFVNFAIASASATGIYHNLFKEPLPEETGEGFLKDHLFCC